MQNDQAPARDTLHAAIIIIGTVGAAILAHQAGAIEPMWDVVRNVFQVIRSVFGA